MYRPMPSPRGTNHEQLFISSGPAAAYDSFNGLSPQEYGRRMARRLTGRLAYDAPEDASESDQNEILSPEYLKTLLDWAKEADLNYEQWAKFNEILKSMSDPNGDYIDGSYISGNDGAPATNGPHLRRAAYAQDGRHRSTGMSEAAKLSLEAICPGLSRIKVL
jgi:hypothetical protein